MSAHRNKITYIGEEPDFIRKFKAKVGYKEESNVESKRDAAAKFIEDREQNPDDDDREEERPLVVVMKPGDLSEAEAEKLGAFDKKEEIEEPADGKILFKKPGSKRSTTNDLNITSKKKKTDDDKETDEKEPSHGTKNDASGEKKRKKKKPQKTLLSFDEEEDEEDDG